MIRVRRAAKSAFLFTTLVLFSHNAFAQRDHVHVVGSSTAFPIISAAAEFFGRNSEYMTPVVESTGTGGGFKLFCSGLGLTTPDMVMASRRMRRSEYRRCIVNEVSELREIRIGFDGIVVANRMGGPRFDLSARDLYYALARWIPVKDQPGKLILNPYTRWREINPGSPDIPIRVYGPPPTSGTRDILVERLMHEACMSEPYLQEMYQGDRAEFQQRCYSLREDGHFINAGENDTRVVRKLGNDPFALGILGFNYLDRNRDRLQAASVNDVYPEMELIETGSYPLSRPLYVYLKSAHEHISPGLLPFLDDLMSDASSGPEGRLAEKGLIPLPGRVTN